MTQSFVIADTHFGHANILDFLDAEDRPLRPFSSVEEMDEALVDRWNSVVGKGDTVYHLGDVVIHKRFLPILDRLKGRKVLIKGNHDIFKPEVYLQYFADIRAYKVSTLELDGIRRKVIMSHIPIHPESLGRFGVNVHGHLHSNKLPDPRYICVSVEHTNYAPISFDEVCKLMPPL